MSRELTIGRKSDNHLVIPDPSVSSRHCIIRELPDGTCLIEDLNSSNGTFINGKRISQTMIKPGDQLLLAGWKIWKTVFSLLMEPQLKRTGSSLSATEWAATRREKWQASLPAMPLQIISASIRARN